MGQMCGLGHGAVTSEEVRGATAAGRTGNDCYCYYYFPSSLLSFIVRFTDALCNSLFVIVYSHTYLT